MKHLGDASMMGKLFGPRRRGGRRRRKPVQLQFRGDGESVAASDFLVTTADDNGDNNNPTPGSLRQAILTANSTPGQVTIDFQIGSGPQAIVPPSPLPTLSPLPTITNQVTIDGTSQPGYTFYPLITIDGLHAGANANGLTISGGSTTVHGLDIVRFTGNGIDLNSHGGDVIDSSIIGTDFSGDFGLGNSGSGVMIDNVPGQRDRDVARHRQPSVGQQWRRPLHLGGRGDRQSGAGQLHRHQLLRLHVPEQQGQRRRDQRVV